MYGWMDGSKYVCMYVCMFVCMHGWMYVCLHTCMYVGTYVRMYVRTRYIYSVYIYIHSVCVCVYVYIYILDSQRILLPPTVSDLHCFSFQIPCPLQCGYIYNNFLCSCHFQHVLCMFC